MSSHLKILTYMVPDLPLELYQTYQNLFEKVLGAQSLLCIENRTKSFWKDLDSGAVDIAFLSSSTYVSLAKKESSHYKLLPVAPTFDHENGKAQVLSYADVIIAKDKEEDFKTFDDLRGHRWAVTDSECIFGCSGVLGELRKMGHNAHFFGNFVHTKFQRDVVQTVLDRNADAGAVECCVLDSWKRENPGSAEEIVVLTSWGPYAPNPVIISDKLPGDTQTKLSRALINLSEDHPEFVERFGKFGITGFQTFNPELYSLTSEVLEAGHTEQLYPVYY